MFLHRILLLLLLVVTTEIAQARAQFPFATDTPTTFSFTETYRETIGRDPDEPTEFIDRIESRLQVNVRGSLKGIDPAFLNSDDTSTTIDIGGLLLDVDFGDAPATTDSQGYKVRRWFFDGTDPATFEPLDDACKVTIRYNANEILYELISVNVHEDFQIQAPDEAGSDEVIDRTPLLVDFAVGDYGFNGRICYVSGIAGSHEQIYGDGEVASGLANVDLEGEIDVVAPKVSIKSPLGRDTVNINPVTVTGTYEEEFFIKTVSLQANGGAFVPVTVNSNGTWTASVDFIPGRNTLIARAEDQDGNIRDSDPVKPVFSAESEITVNAAGNGSGTVTADFIDPINYTPGVPSAVENATLNAGQTYVITATPEASIVFAGWTTNAPLTPAQLQSPVLIFEMAGGMTLTANFVTNPFTPVQGKFNGLATSDPDAADFGTLTGSVTSTGTFSLKAKIGKLTIPIKGQFTGGGAFTAQVRVKKVVYTVELHLNVSGVGPAEITGTIVGGTIDAELSAVRAGFKNKTNPVPAEFVGTFNVLLPASEENDDENFPHGVGFGRATVKPSGKVTFVGKLADGSNVSVGTALSPEHVWPFFAALYGKQGAIAGFVEIDPTDESSDLSGDLAWYKPAGAKPKAVHSAGFSGNVALLGSKFVKPATGQLVFLQDSTGAGEINFTTASLDESFAGTLGANGKFTATIPGESPIQNLVCSVNAKTGLLKGTFRQSGAVRKFQGIAAGSKVNQAGAYFIADGLSGAVTITAP